MTTAHDPADVTSALVGNRRAHQLLRLVDLEDAAAADRFLDDAVDVVTGIWVDAALNSVWRVTRDRTDEVPEELRKRWQILEAVDYPRPHRGSAIFNDEAARRHLRDKAQAVTELLAVRWPRRDDRVRFYETSARNSFDSEEPGSHVRRTVFGETPS